MPYIFISYSHKDSEYAHRLAQSLEQAGFGVWIDERIDYGTTWPDVIQEQLDGCNAFIVVMTSRAYGSAWVKNELSRAQRKRKAVFPLLLEGDIWLSVEATQHVDVSNGALPPASFYSKLAEVVPVQKAAAPVRPDLLILDKPFRLELVRVPAGEFLMGSDPAKDPVAFDDEKPQHRLHLPEYYIGKNTVTVSQFAAFAQAQSYQTEAERDGWGRIYTGIEWKKENGASWSHPRGPKSDVVRKGDHPVTQVTWRDAQAFCLWVSKASGRAIRLPSEAEWEKAARGVDGRVYPWGNQAPDAELCNFNNNVGDTTPVGHYLKGASPYGVLDMAGNVLEWTLSLWGKDAVNPQFRYPYKSTDGREDLQAGVDIKRVTRGGSYDFDDGGLRCVCRDGNLPDLRYDLIGFRVVCVSPPHHASGL